MKKIFLTGVIIGMNMNQGFAAPIPLAQQPAELAYQLAKYYQLAGEKQLSCQKKKGINDTPEDSSDYGNFSLKAKADALSFTGNPGIQAGRVELSVNDLITVGFFDDNQNKKYVALIPNSQSLLSNGEAEGTLMAVDSGKTPRVTPLQCKLK